MANNDSETQGLIRTPKQLAAWVILGFLVPLTSILLIVELITCGMHLPERAMTETMLIERLEPIGKIKIQGITQPENSTLKESTTPKTHTKQKEKITVDGEKVYNAVCQTCHMAGVAGAPALDNKNAWAPRLKKDRETLYASAINGIGVMPAKGGAVTYTDAEIKAAVDYMLSKIK